MTAYLRENFKLIRLVHNSTKTKIFLVSEIDSGKKFLLKVISRTGLLYAQIAKLQSPILPKIFHVEESGATTYVVEEFLQGADLQEHLERHGALDEKTAYRLAIELCDGLQEIHKRHIIHRDIKPSNLFLTDAGQLKLLDFDAARLEKPDRFSDTYFIGTPGFAAPEQYGFQQTDERTDIYSLGLTFKLLLGYKNYRGYLLSVLDKCTEFDPTNRFDSVQSLKRALIRQNNIRHWKKFAVVACVCVVSFAGFSLLSNAAQDVESPVPAENFVYEEIQLPPEKPIRYEVPATKISIAEKNIVEPLPAPKENFSAEEIKLPPEKPIHYAQPESIKLPATLEIAPTTPKWEIDFSAAYSTEVRELGIPRKVLEERLPQDLSAEEREKKIDEYYRRMELNARQKDFKASLPDEMTDNEKHEAEREFRLRAKNALNL